ncbi:MAG: hypothetical protein MJZ84_08765 [Paludibacteraceae bacterium]|nr:hypothetical protein [Paludibacteraceae bacterium]
MRKDYIMPQTGAQTICVSQLMAGSTKSMGFNNDPLNGSNSEGIKYGG